jgi:sugar O-acyltransferase (sialic acid O-acetyltransferase NeuD family)
MEKPLMIIGTSDLGKAVLDIFKSNEVLVYGFLDTDASKHKTEINEVPILGSYEDEVLLQIIGKDCEAFVALPDPKERERIVKMLIQKRKAMPVNAIHRASVIDASASLGHGNLIAARSYIGANAKIGNHCFLHAGAIVDYSAEVHDFVQIGAGAIINSNVHIGEGALIGSGATIISGVKIGKNASVGFGSLVLKDVAEGQTVFGVPAQKI